MENGIEKRVGMPNTGCVYDAQLKLLLQDRRLAADLCNAMVYGGKAVVSADMLEPFPVEQNAVFEKDNGSFSTDNRYRDLAFYVRMNDKKGFLLCIEIQTSQDAAMPLRVLEYNARDYAKFRRSISAKSDILMPLVVTLVLNFSSDSWRGPLSIHDMALYADPSLRKVVDAGRMLLVDPYVMEEKILSRFCTEWKFMLCCIRLSRDKNALMSFLEAHKDLCLTHDMMVFLSMFFDVEWNNDVGSTAGGVKSMCEAIRQMRQESFSQGISQGIEQGISQGIERGRHDVAVNALLMKMSHEVVHKLTGLSLERIASIAKSMDTAQA